MKANDDFHVLILEDEVFICNLLELGLGELDVNLHTAHDCKTATALAMERKPDLAILDIGLPDGDGRDFARELRRVYRADSHPIPVIFLTGRLDQGSRVEAYMVDAIDYITKPFSIMEISMKMRNLINIIKVQKTEALSSEIATSPVRPKKLDLYMAVVDLCQSKCSDENFSIDQAATALGVSTRTLQRRLSSSFETSFSEILLNTRMERARVYLENDYSIKETSRACGYRHVENFSTAFLRVNKMTPKDFRSAQQGQ